MDIIHYLKPYKGCRKSLPGITPEHTVGAGVSFFNGDSDWFRHSDFDLVIIGVPESRNGAGNYNCSEAPDLIRNWLYALRSFDSEIRIGDAGNVLGSGLNDRFQAVKEVVAFFLQRKVTILVLGGTHDLSIPVYQAVAGLVDKINLAVGDAMLDVDILSDDFSSRSWLSHLIGANSKSLNDVTVFGQQGYLVTKEQEQYLRSRYYDMVRLGDIRGDEIDKTEVIMRDAHMVSIDFRMIKNQPQFDETILSPHGVEPFDACRISRYGGMSDKVKVFGIFEVPVMDNQPEDNVLLAAQMIWHFLEGLSVRFMDYPARDADSYKQYIVAAEGVDQGLKFFRNPVNDRWWMEVPTGSEPVIIACSRQDYRKALRKELPEKWWRFFLKYSQPDCEENKNRV